MAAQAAVHLAVAHAYAGGEEEALEAAKRAVKLDPHAADVRQVAQSVVNQLRLRPTLRSRCLKEPQYCSLDQT